MRIKFKKGRQREFIEEVLAKLMAPSLRSLKQYGINVNYQTLKAYYNESRNLPESLFMDLCILSGIEASKAKVKRLTDNWGQVKGGKK
jgi:hypothetical protein